MAFTMTYTKKQNGFSDVIAPSYVKVGTVSGTKESAIARVVFSSEDKEIVLHTAEYRFDTSVSDNSANFIKQAYTYLKTLPEFENAKDC